MFYHFTSSCPLDYVLFEGKDCGLKMTAEFKNILIILFEDLFENMAILFLFTESTTRLILVLLFCKHPTDFCDCSY